MHKEVPQNKLYQENSEEEGGAQGHNAEPDSLSSNAAQAVPRGA